jgi:general secretion pathway protein G
MSWLQNWKTKHIVMFLLALIAVTILCARVVPFLTDGSSIPIAAREVTVMWQLNDLKSALDLFQLDNGCYPPGTNGMHDLLHQPAWATNWHGPYAEQGIKDPWNHKYHYKFPGEHTNRCPYDLFSLGGYPGNHIQGNWQQ